MFGGSSGVCMSLSSLEEGEEVPARSCAASSGVGLVENGAARDGWEQRSPEGGGGRHILVMVGVFLMLGYVEGSGKGRAKAEIERCI